MDTKMLWSACCICILGFLRAGEMTVPGDEEYDPQVHLSVMILLWMMGEAHLCCAFPLNNLRQTRSEMALSYSSGVRISALSRHCWTI